MTKKYRQKGYEARLHEDVMNSPAWLDLRPTPRVLLLEFLLIYRPSRNGKLSISEKAAINRLNVSPKLAARAFYELSEHGFIKISKYQDWMNGQAREWSLTFKPVNSREPTNEYMQWKKGKNMNPELQRPKWLKN